MHRFLIAAVLGLLPATGLAQQSGLDHAAEGARSAWLAHNPVALIAASPRLLIQLPGADPSVALGPAQAAALLADFLAPAQEVEVLVRAAREVEPGRGYVELQRRYRVTGTQDIRSQVLLLGYRLDPSGWKLVEFRVVS
ncbi:MAG: hypothetical protein ACXWWN_10240 [Gemmatimonadales bacterium]